MKMKKRILAVLIIVLAVLSMSAKKTTKAVQTESLPTKFDLRDKINIKVENQGGRGYCWTFASLNSLETYLNLKGYGDYDFSEVHLGSIVNGFRAEENYHGFDSGTFESFLRYYAENKGPVLESEIPYYKDNIHENEYTEEDRSMFEDANKVGYIYDIEKWTTDESNIQFDYYKDNDELLSSVKSHIMNYGSIYAEIDAGYINTNFIGDDYYTVLNSNEGAKINHAISIIGWDDEFSKEKFSEDTRPKNDGAYIALNSWGEEFGDNGIFYISYEDSLVNTKMFGIKSASIELDKNKLIPIHIEDDAAYNKIKSQVNYVLEDDQTNTLYLSKVQKDIVTSVDLSGIKFKSLKYLENFDNCTFFVFENCGIEDLSVLDDIEAEKIYFLDIAENNVTDLDKISNYHNIGSLDLSGNKKIKDLSPICELQSLDWLVINNCELTDISGLSKITANNVDIESDPVQVELKNNNITDVSVLENANIAILDLSGNKKINKIGNLKNVVNLNLSDCDIDDASIIQNLSNVKYLYLDNNKIKDINVLDMLPDLWVCSMKNQKISDEIFFDNEVKEYKYELPTIISSSGEYDVLLDTEVISYDMEKLKWRKEGMFDSIDINGATLSEDYSNIYIKDISSNGTVTLTVNGGIADGTVYTIKYKVNDKQNEEEQPKQDEEQDNEEQLKQDNYEDKNNRNSNKQSSDKDIKDGNNKSSSEKKKNDNNKIAQNIKTGDAIAMFVAIIIISTGIIFILKKSKNNIK